MVKRSRREPPIHSTCFLSSICLGLVLRFIGPWECLHLVTVSRSWHRIVRQWISKQFSLAHSSNLLRPAVRVLSRIHTHDLHAVMANDGQHILVTRGMQGLIFRSNQQIQQPWTTAYSIENAAAEFLASGQLFLLQKAAAERSKQIFFTNDWNREPVPIAPQLVNVQPIGVDDKAQAMIAQYTNYSNGVHCEMKIIKVDLCSGAVKDTQIRLYSGRRFLFEHCLIKGVQATRIVIVRNPHRSDEPRLYKSPIYMTNGFNVKDAMALTFSELAHLVSPCGRWLSCGCWLTNPTFGVTDAWFTASVFDLRNSTDAITKRINFSDCYSNSIVSSFSADGDYLLLGWRRHQSNVPWESMDIFNVPNLFVQARNACSLIKPVCRFTRNLCLSGDPNTRLAVTWSGHYVLMAEVSGISILDPHQNGALLAVILSSYLARSLPGARYSRILNIFCGGQVALYWVPTNRSCTIGSLLLCELLTCRTLLTVLTRVPFYESLGESVFVSDDCRTVSVKCQDNSIRIFDCYSIKEQTVFV